MVEVFKTNVQHRELAEQLASILRGQFDFSRINFDLEDCDRIMRIVSTSPVVQVDILIDILKGFGYHAEVLLDDDYTFTKSYTPPLFLLN